MATAATAAWAPQLAGVRGLLLDISGVLYDGGEGGGTPIPGSIEAVARIKQSGLKLRFCTNESQKSRDKFVGLLQRLGFDISVNEVTSPAPAACQILKERGLRPHLLVHDDVRSEFSEMDTSNPNCVVIADAGDGFSYQNLNEAFRVLISLDNPVLISLGNGRYYKEASGLMLDVGPYTKALEYACDVRAEVVGKPAPEFFKAALKEMGLEAQQALMIGDDIMGDVAGAQRCGMRALQVRTGKFRSVSLTGAGHGERRGLWGASLWGLPLGPPLWTCAAARRAPGLLGALGLGREARGSLCSWGCGRPGSRIRGPPP
ncbi:phospholysine phosphohistidine inorganic pyrophosphate phosphatase [Monodelphis domestica]|uniref:phospholysine phosphohistidine inorganic pyrophosphate phosphatase n=1 Tax=Monodelphis domestica TaxID=13616 RepID=UPI0024E24519|nr:phospholysine phosphohistidine inorganic pyrophosphate phosphatase [Monodelphis domestica]